MRHVVTITSMARELGMSVSAVSKALNDYPDISEETKKLVRKKAIEQGYSPNLMARNLARKSSNFLGIVIRDVSSIYGEMFKSLNVVARRYGLHLILYDTGYDPVIEKECIRNLIDSMAMGIVVAPVTENISEIRAITEGRVPVVFLGGRVRDEGVNYVCADSLTGAEIALRHLTDMGHRKIVMLCDHKESSSRSRKVAVYRETMKALGEKELVCFSDASEADLVRAGYQLTGRLLTAGEKFTALFAVKDLMAIGAIGALREAGVDVPGQVSVVGYDGIEASSLPPIGLTTIGQPRMEMAEMIIDILRRHAQDPSSPPEHYLAQPELLIRNSTQRR